MLISEKKPIPNATAAQAAAAAEKKTHSIQCMKQADGRNKIVIWNRAKVAAFLDGFGAHEKNVFILTQNILLIPPI